MDEFVVLTEIYGLNPRVKSSPMAALKRSVVNPNSVNSCHFDSGDDENAELTSNYSKFDDFVVFDELNKLFTNDPGKTESYLSGDSSSGNSKILKTSSSNVISYDAGYLFTVMPESISSSINAVGDLLGDLAGLSPKAKSLNQNISGSMGENEDVFDDLIPGFGGNGQPSNSKFQETEAVEVKKQHFGVDDLDSLFIPGPRSSSVPDSWGAKKPVAPAQFLDDFFPLFEADPFPGESEELPGESDGRRLARWEREQRIKKQLANAVADMNNRDRQIQIEQEERGVSDAVFYIFRISETLDAEIKLWAAGKEGNLRALLSSLHLVLWPGCGWEAVSLTDLITSTAVKKVYRKANLYVHPDKVQQKGAQQKYIAENVFNILQEAWKKFNKEELS